MSSSSLSEEITHSQHRSLKRYSLTVYHIYLLIYYISIKARLKLGGMSRGLLRSR